MAKNKIYDTQLIPRKLLFGNPEKAFPVISPDATKIAYLSPDQDNTLNVWLKDLSSLNGSDQIVTKDKKRGIRYFIWQFDNKHILYVQDNDGDENWHLYQTNIETKETRNLTPYKGVQVNILDYNHHRPKEILILMNYTDPSCFDVYCLNLESGQVTLLESNKSNVFKWIPDPKGHIRGTLHYSKEGDIIVSTRDSTKSAWKELMCLASEEMEGNIIGFTHDEKSLYFISSLDNDKSRLLLIDLQTGVKTVLAEDPIYDISPKILLNPTSSSLEAVAIEREKLDWIVVDNSIKKEFEILKNTNYGIFNIISRDLNNQYWVVSFDSDTKPATFFLFNRQTEKLTFLFSECPELEQYQLSPMKPISFQSRDGLTLHGYLTLPLKMTKKSLSPAVLLVHGGPWYRDTWGLHQMVQWLVNRGIAVLQINFRGSTGYGKTFLNAGNREWGGKMHDDLIDGKKWLISQGFVDSKKIGIFGASYGGYAALVGLTFTPEEFCCGVTLVGPSNLITLLQTIPPYWTSLKAQFNKRVGTPEIDQEFLKSRSPLFKANQITKPLLIGQGANDPRVKQNESTQIVTEIRRNQKEVEYLLFLDEGHGFARSENRLKFFAAAEHFLANHLQANHQIASEEEKWDEQKV